MTGSTVLGADTEKCHNMCHERPTQCCTVRLNGHEVLVGKARVTEANIIDRHESPDGRRCRSKVWKT